MLPPSNPLAPVRFALIEIGSNDKARFTFSTENIETRKLSETSDLDKITLPIHVEEVPLEIQSREGKDGIVLYKDDLKIPFTSTLTHGDGRVESIQQTMTETKTREVKIYDIDDKKKVHYSIRVPKTKTVMATISRPQPQQPLTRVALETAPEFETRVKIIRRDEKLVRVLKPTHRNTAFSLLSFSNIKGESLSHADVTEACQKSQTDRIPIVLIAPGHSLPEYFKLILIPQTLVVEDPFYK